MLETADNVRELLRCPRTGEPLEPTVDGGLRSRSGCDTYPSAHGVPVLIDFGDTVLAKDYVWAGASSPVHRRTYGGGKAFVKKLLSPPRKSTRENVAILLKLLHEKPGAKNVLIVGGGSVGQGMAPLYEHPDIRVHAFDIFYSENIQFIADAHKIPLPDRYYDAVVIQAVLEHVLEPARVVEEIWRVLAPEGLVYAETPFMQHVHEGAYDFTRFTNSGHRYLFRKFETVRSGASAGAGTTLVWSIDYFFRSLFRSRTAGKAVKLIFFWIRLFDQVIPDTYNVDAASGTFFLGRKSEQSITPLEAVSHYCGAQR